MEWKALVRTIGPAALASVLALSVAATAQAGVHTSGLSPVTTIDSGPLGEITQNDVSFLFSSEEPEATFECALDGEPFSPCTSPKSYDDLTKGDHTFRVRAVGAPVPVERSFTVLAAGPVGRAKLKITTFSPGRPTVKQDRRVRIKVVGRNTGAAAATGAELCITVSRRVRKSLERKSEKCVSLGTLGAGRSKSALFVLKGTDKVRDGGRYELSFELSASSVRSNIRTVIVRGR